MKILVLSDIHGWTSSLSRILKVEKEYDYVFIAGDITNFGSLKSAIKVLEFMAEKTGRKIFFVPGNCDPPELLEYQGSENIVNVHGKLYGIGDAVIMGIGGSLITPFNTLIEFTEEFFKKTLEKLAKLLSNYRGGIVKILITHTPPYGTKLDIIRSGEHVGSISLRDFLEKHPINLCVCGHIHESYGVDRVGSSIAVNPGPASWGHYAIIHLKHGGGIDVELRKV